MKGTVYTVDREVEMTDDAFREFGKDFLKDQPGYLKPMAATTRRASTDALGSEMWTQVKGYWFRQRDLTILGILGLSLMMRWRKFAEMTNNQIGNKGKGIGDYHISDLL